MHSVFPVTLQEVEAISRQFPMPFYLYEEAAIIRNSDTLYEAMRVAGFTDFVNYFAIKALPNPHIIRILSNLGQGVDCSSLAELELAAMIGLEGSRIMFSSNNTTMAEYKRAVELGAIINFDDISHIQPFLSAFGVPDSACCRYNPGDISFDDAEQWIMGKPSEAKFGMTKPQIIEAYKMLKEAGAKRFGLHAMLLSNDIDWRNHARIARLLFELAAELKKKTDVTFSFINLGGGIGVPYRPKEQLFDFTAFSAAVKEAYDAGDLKNIGAPRIVMENGRYITGDAGYLVTKVLNIKDTHRKYIGVDASMSDLMRPGMYGAYHHITVLGKENSKKKEVVDVTGSLCENNDKFAVGRKLPPIDIGDYLVIHTTGAHSHAMGFQYNGKLRPAELLLQPDGTVECIRRAETLQDYFATLSGAGVLEIKEEK